MRILFIGDKADVMRFQHCWSSSGFNVASTKTLGRDPENDCINILQRRILSIDHWRAVQVNVLDSIIEIKRPQILLCRKNKKY